MNVVILYGRVLLSLWSLPTHKMISLDVVHLKSVLWCMFKTSHGLTKINKFILKFFLFYDYTLEL